MNVLEKILEEIERTRKSIIDMSDEEPELVDAEDWFDEGVDQGKLIAYEVAKEIIRSHIDHSGDDTEMGDWIPVEERLPEDCEEIVLVQVSGKMAENIWFDNAFELATYVNGEGWILENYQECENPKVIAWQPLPEPYKPKK